MNPMIIAALIQAAASVGGGMLANAGNARGETSMQRKQSKLIDQLLAGLQGQGSFKDLYATDENAFQKSFVDPAKQMFSGQIAPMIQQQSIAGGQQRSSGLDSNLARAGMDIDQMLNQYMYQSQQDALNRKQNTINSILGGGPGAPNQPTMGQSAMSGLAGYLGSDSFASTFKDYMKPQPGRKGFETTASASIGA